MRTLKSTLISTLISTIILLFAVSLFGLEPNDTVPDFTLKDSNGKTHKLSDYSGKYVVLEWVNYDCPFCVKHYSGNNMQKLQKEYTEKGIIWLSICSSADGKQGNFKGKELNDRIKKEGAFCTAYLIDEDGKVGRAIGAKTTPHLFIVSPEGKLAYSGGIDDTPSADSDDIKTAKNYIKTALDEVLSGKKISSSYGRPYGCGVKYEKKK